jgi:ATP-dependent protease HslVU (ClpYQ) peptidase subunit
MTLAQKSDRILAQTRGLSGATPNATRLIEELRLALESNRNDVQRLTAERDEAKERNVRLLSQLQEYEVREF